MRPDVKANNVIHYVDGPTSFFDYLDRMQERVGHNTIVLPVYPDVDFSVVRNEQTPLTPELEVETWEKTSFGWRCDTNPSKTRHQWYLMRQAELERWRRS